MNIWIGRHPWISATIAAVLGFVVLGVLQSTEVIPSMNEGVLIQMIATTGLILIAVIANSAKQKQDTRRAADAAESAAVDAALARDQLQNNHSTNLREENDERHDEVMGTLTNLGGRVDDLADNLSKMSNLVLGILQDDTTTRQQAARRDQRLDRLEKLIVSAGRHEPDAQDYLEELERTLDARVPKKGTTP